MSTQRVSGSDVVRDQVWLVSTPTRRRQAGTSVDLDEPWGMRHARRLGDMTTACGQAAVNWHLFMGRQFTAGLETCAECVRAVTRGGRTSLDGWS